MTISKYSSYNENEGRDPTVLLNREKKIRSRLAQCICSSVFLLLSKQFPKDYFWSLRIGHFQVLTMFLLFAQVYNGSHMGLSAQ
jgi:hypothetical protein